MNKKPTYQELEKQVQELKMAHDEGLRQLLRNSFDMIVLMDANGVQKYVSESCEKILGYRSDELIDIFVIEKMIHPDDQEIVKQGFKGIIQKTDHGGTQYRHKHKNGGWVYLEAYGNNQLDNPFIKSIVLNVRDITDRKKAEKALKESESRLSELNATKDRFFSIIAHDLKSPFNSILGFSELLIEQIQNEKYEVLENYAKHIQISAQRAMDLLNNLLEWSQAQTGRINFNPTHLNLSETIDSVIELLNDSAQKKSISIIKNLPDNLLIFADNAMLNTILRNLIANGIKFTKEGGKITIGSKTIGNAIVVSFADNGIGIEEKIAKNLFRIDTGHSTPGTQNESGTGLGLLLCKEFVDFHKGKIWVESSPGKGSTFYFSLPTNNS